MTQSEWRLLYGLRSLSDEQGRWWFVTLHVPLFWMLIALTNHRKDCIQRWSCKGVAAFCVIHALLHWRLAIEPLSTFNSPLSWGLILGAGALGAIHLGMAAYSFKIKQS